MVYVRFDNPNLQADWDKLTKEAPALTATLRRAVNAFYPNPGPTKNPPPALDTVQAIVELSNRNPDLAKWVYGFARHPCKMSVPGLTPETPTTPGFTRCKNTPPPNFAVPFDTRKQVDQWDAMASSFPSLAAALELVLAPGGTGTVDLVLANPVLAQQHEKIGSKHPELGQWFAKVLGAAQAGRLHKDADPGAGVAVPGLASVTTPSQATINFFPEPLRSSAKQLTPQHLVDAEALLLGRSR